MTENQQPAPDSIEAYDAIQEAIEVLVEVFGNQTELKPEKQTPIDSR